MLQEVLEIINGFLAGAVIFWISNRVYAIISHVIGRKHSKLTHVKKQNASGSISIFKTANDEIWESFIVVCINTVFASGKRVVDSLQLPPPNLGPTFDGAGAAWIAGAQMGSVAYNVPSEMKVGVLERIEVRLTKEHTDQIAKLARLTAGMDGRGKIKVEQIEIIDRIRVVLLGEAFAITPLNNPDQRILAEGFNEWDFDIRPKQRGNHMLRLLITQRVRAEGEEDFIDLPAIDRPVRVLVNPAHSIMAFGRENWKWLLGGIFASLGWLILSTPPGQNFLKLIGLMAATPPAQTDQTQQETPAQPKKP